MQLACTPRHIAGLLAPSRYSQVHLHLFASRVHVAQSSGEQLTGTIVSSIVLPAGAPLLFLLPALGNLALA